jgi:hypothetical protein
MVNWEPRAKGEVEEKEKNLKRESWK